MKKRGFTLVELIAVVALLSILIIILAPNIVRTIKNMNKKIDSSVEKTFIAAVNDYVYNNLNTYDVTSKESYCVPVKNVIDGGYLSMDTFNLQKKLEASNTFFKVTPNGESFDYNIDYEGYCMNHE